MIRALSGSGAATPRLRTLNGRSAAVGSLRRRCFSSQQQGRQQQHNARAQPPGGWAVAASAALSASLLGVGLTLCEAPAAQSKQSNVVPPRRMTTKSGMKDPMTQYQQYAIQREQKEQQNSLTATSASFELTGDDDEDCDDIEDPMTRYQQHAIQRAIAQVDAYQHEQLQKRLSQPPTQQELEDGRYAIPTYSATLQATSPDTDTEPQPPPHSSVKQSFPPEMTASEVRLEESARNAKKHSGGIKVFSGNGNMSLALEITRHLGISLGKATVGRFADGECNVVIKENVRGKDVYVVQPTCPPVNDNLMELLLMVSTLRRASARRITVVIPYYGYARQDRKMQARVPISAADVARLMEAIGVDRVIAVDLHCGQIQGFFGPRVPVDNLDGGIVGLDYFGSKDLHNPVIVSPDAGGVYRAKKFKEGLEQKYDLTDLGLAMIVKQRARAGTVDQMDLVGDVKDCDCIIVDDMIDTAGTLCKAADVLKANGAARVFAFASHGLLSGPGNERIAASQMEEVVVLNTIPTSPQREANEKLTELSVASLLAQAIFNIHAKKSISALFK